MGTLLHPYAILKSKLVNETDHLLILLDILSIGVGRNCMRIFYKVSGGPQLQLKL